MIQPFGDIWIMDILLVNNGDDIRSASNKLEFFKLMKENDPDIIPKFWTSKSEIPDDAYPVVCRTLLSSHSGAGIVIANDSSGVVDAPLYVQYVKKKDEYRVHIGYKNGESFVIALQRKAVPSGTTPKDWQVRNVANGFIFVRTGFTVPAAVVDAATRAFKSTGLDFGAVDVIWNDNQEKAYVLEINTAPGLEGQTVKDYAEFFKTLYAP
jgi:glutathione synthase/RimK-type ligase-like ATP-grasp enzyme